MIDKKAKDIMEVIRTRRSIRKFKAQPIDDEIIRKIIEMGTWAPSGLNNQPWKFVIIKDKELKDKVAQQTRYSRIIQNAPVCIGVFLDNSQSYNRVKDIQAIGACIQNMLITIHSLGLGAVWLGEILNKREEVEKILNVSSELELMAVVALGYPAESGGKGSRKKLDEVILYSQ